MQFKEVVGQEKLKERLIHNITEGRISHAQLFLGKVGHGSLPLALAYAQFINCTDKQKEDSCGNCNSCLKTSKLSHPDLHFSFPVNTNRDVKTKPLSNNFLKAWREINQESPYFDIDDWHQKIDIEQKQSLISVNESQEIIKKLSFKPYESEFKILILFKVEHLNPAAANKLLKLIEEPTDKTVILLIAEEEEQLLKTITSRTQLVRIPPIKDSSINDYLIRKQQVDEQTANQVAAFAEGDVIKALHRLNKTEEDQLFFVLFKSWMRGCYEANIDKMYAWVEEISSRNVGREKQKRFLEYTLELMREGIITNYLGGELQRLDGEAAVFLKKFAPFVHGNNIMGIMDLLNEAHQQISRNAYSKILFMDMSMKFANLLRVK